MACDYFSKTFEQGQMAPVAGFKILKRAAQALTPGQFQIHFAGTTSVTIDFIDGKDGMTKSRTFDLLAVSKLSERLHSSGQQDPQWCERKGKTSSGDAMSACLLRLEGVGQAFGDLNEGYPEPRFANAAASMAALSWLKGSQDSQVRGPPNRGVMDTRPASPHDASPFFRRHRTPEVTLSQDRYQFQQDRDHRNDMRLASPDTAMFKTGYGYSVPHHSQPEASSLKSNAASPCATGTTGWLASRSSKRPAREDLFKENEPPKRPKNRGRNAPFIDRYPDDYEYNRVEHVDGRYGF
jgi:hypothetical protein